MRRCILTTDIVLFQVMLKSFFFLIFIATLTIVFTGFETTSYRNESVRSIINSDSVLIISKQIDLKGKVYTLPPKGTVCFISGGCLYNGTLIGNETKLRWKNHTGIFKNVMIKGSWIVDTISTRMFKNIDRHTLSNISSLISDKIHNEVFIYKTCMIAVPDFASYFVVKSNTNINFYADIYTLSTKYNGGYAMEIRGRDININGNEHIFTGTLLKDSQNRKEWQHGIYINKNSKNITIKNLKLKYFWGDGIYVMGQDIIVDNVECAYNGRQGLSITKGNNISIKNSSFHHTGAKAICFGKGPGAGIDIEPNESDVVNNVLIENCRLYDNYRYLQGYINDFQAYKANKADIVIRKCKIGGVYLGSSSEIRFENGLIQKTIYGIDSNLKNITLHNIGNPKITQNLRLSFIKNK